jgi:hypothetical protein
MRIFFGGIGKINQKSENKNEKKLKSGSAAHNKSGSGTGSVAPNKQTKKQTNSGSLAVAKLTLAA